mmetsp:Transcript_17799/g.12749  ORF Transcript_17799/g.12749 Transcript_17799/m.12749 type:complete len:118 (+) Transcript_17799:1790-2143(+)|eukprot:CAMPEP_0202960992 /NCGR_PEP_ID=MMETSP1396-20130829/5098_1 /ASSEMBLY_ACC=CAM_ASM_000872 /TAXON_ID= /ORGANISM="Pseudokeronopsis sp., Strain Brazil" /LENGTH=117 /DNA_ID=CAMNT_0049680539 /DNA_START=1790 /DNA_END=2143 /DNA_ORIENTATION=-
MSVNKNSSLLKKIRADASPKVVRANGEISAKGSNSTEIHNLSLRVYLEQHPPLLRRYLELLHEYDGACKQFTVKILQTFRGKRAPNPQEVGQAQLLLMLLSAVDKTIMLTNDKSNIV